MGIIVAGDEKVSIVLQAVPALSVIRIPRCLQQPGSL